MKPQLPRYQFSYLRTGDYPSLTYKVRNNTYPTNTGFPGHLPCQRCDDFSSQLIRITPPINSSVIAYFCPKIFELLNTVFFSFLECGFDRSFILHKKGKNWYTLTDCISEFLLCIADPFAWNLRAEALTNNQNIVIRFINILFDYLPLIFVSRTKHFHTHGEMIN